MEEKIKTIADLKAFDILLCYGKDSKKDFIGKKIKKITNSDYVHAAIFIGNGYIAESLVKKGVSKNKIQVLLSRYDYIAVLRHPDIWSEDKEITLNNFISKLNNSEYSISKVLKFEKNKMEHKVSINSKLKAYFDNKYTPQEIEKEKYFCSELVVDCFIKVNFISESAAVLYQSDTYSPGDLSKDGTFGFFYGYLLTKQDKKNLLLEDKFFYDSTFDEIFNYKTHNKI